MATETAEPSNALEAERPATGATRTRVLQWLVWGWAAIEAALLAGAPLLFPDTHVVESAGDNVEFVAFLVTLAFAVMAFATAGLVIRQQPRNASAGRCWSAAPPWAPSSSATRWAPRSSRSIRANGS